MFIPMWLLITVGIILAVAVVVVAIIIRGLLTVTSVAGQAAEGLMNALWNR